MRPSAPALYPSPNITTHADPIGSLPLRTFLASTLAPRRQQRIRAVSLNAARFAASVMLGVHYTKLVVVEVESKLRSLRVC